MILKNKVYLSTIILSLIILVVSKTFAEIEDVNIKIDGFIIKNPQIVYKDVNAKMATGYFEIENTNNFDEKLMFVTGDISNRIEIHNTKMDDGVPNTGYVRSVANGNFDVVAHCEEEYTFARKKDCTMAIRIDG